MQTRPLSQSESFTRRLVAFLLCVALASFLSSLRAQSYAIESLLDAYATSPGVAVANAFFDRLDSERFTERHIRFADRVPIDSVSQQVWYWASEWYYDRQQYDKARSYGQKALPLFHGAGAARADCLNLLAIASLRLSDFTAAASYARQCLDIDMASGDPDRISSSMNTLAATYMAARQTTEAKKMILQAIEYADRADNPSRKAILLGMASEVHHTLGEEEAALDYAQRAHDIEVGLGRTLQAAVRLDQKASALMGLKRFDEAEATLRQAIAVLREQDERHSLAIASNHLGMCLLERKRSDEACVCFRTAADIFVRLGDPFNELHARRGLCLSLLGSHPDSARVELDRFHHLKDSLYTTESAEALARLEAELGNDLLAQENAMIRSARVRDLIIGVAVLAVVILGLYWAARRSRRRQQQHISELMIEIDNLNSHRLDDGAKSGDRPGDGSGLDEDFLQRVIDFVDERLPGGEVSLADMGASMGMDERALQHRLQTSTGEPARAYIQAIQMRKACRLLGQGLAIGTVARQCGFDDLSSFTRTFKRVFGLTPTQYRAQSRAVAQ